MPIRRINFTGRKRLKQQDVRILIRENEDGNKEFDAKLKLSDYELQGDALVFIEAYRQTTFMRFPFGTVEKRRPEKNKLSEFDCIEGVQFRVRVTSVGGENVTEGLSLAEADKIRPRCEEETEGERMPLLPVKPDDSLGEEVYRIDLSDQPLLLINSRVGDWRCLAREPFFVALVLPAALREILNHIIHIEKHVDCEDMDDWRSQWLTCASSFPGVGEIPSEDEEERLDDWIDEVVAMFCRRFGMYEKFEQYWYGESKT